jgi:hypothetical protein
MIKVMVGYYGWTMERNQTEDAFVPILADGAKLMTYLPKARVHFSLGASSTRSPRPRSSPPPTTSW